MKNQLSGTKVMHIFSTAKFFCTFFEKKFNVPFESLVNQY
jgi:hypothetical protein